MGINWKEKLISSRLYFSYFRRYEINFSGQGHARLFFPDLLAARLSEYNKSFNLLAFLASRKKITSLSIISSSSKRDEAFEA